MRMMGAEHSAAVCFVNDEPEALDREREKLYAGTEDYAPTMILRLTRVLPAVVCFARILTESQNPDTIILYTTEEYFRCPAA